MECLFEFDETMQQQQEQEQQQQQQPQEEQQPSPPEPDSSTPSPPLSPLPPPSDDENVIGDFAYSTANLLGHSAVGVCYKGRRISDNRAIAVKVICKAKATHKFNFSKSELDVLDELVNLNHPNIVEIFGYLNEEEKFYIFMEYCNQKDLRAWLHKQNTLSECTIKFYLKQIAEGMKILHNKGIIHRNIKPQNLLLHSNEKDPSSLEMYLKISDFGLARFLGEGTMCAAVCGAAHYMAPEVFLNQPYDDKVDLWSIGAVAYQCATTHTPVSGPNDVALTNFLKNTEDCFVGRPFGMSDQLWDVLYSLLQPLPSKRMSFDEFYTLPLLENISNVPSPRVSAESFKTEYSFGSYSPSKESFLKERDPVEELGAAAADPDVGSPLGDDDIPHNLCETVEEDKKAEEGEDAEGLEGLEGAVGGAGPSETNVRPVDEDLDMSGFVVVPPPRVAHTSSGRIIDAVYDPVFDVILPVVRGESPSPNDRRLS